MTRAPQLGLSIPPGSLPPGLELSELAQRAEAAGAASFWVPDHVVQPRSIATEYPYSADGRPIWAPESPWPEALTTMTWLAASTRTARVGANVLVLPQRDPILTAKVAATLDELSGGRVVLGAGAGWMREEFDILGWDFPSRGRRMEEAMEIMRQCWRGAPEAVEGEFFSLPEGVQCYPTPKRRSIPLLVGGMSDLALRRAGRVGDGWLALAPIGSLTQADLPDLIEGLRRKRDIAHAARPATRKPLQDVVALGRLEERHLPWLERFARLGFRDIVVSVPWSDPDVAEDRIRRATQTLAAAAPEVAA